MSLLAGNWQLMSFCVLRRCRSYCQLRYELRKQKSLWFIKEIWRQQCFKLCIAFGSSDAWFVFQLLPGTDHFLCKQGSSNCKRMKAWAKVFQNQLNGLFCCNAEIVDSWKFSTFLIYLQNSVCHLYWWRMINRKGML